MKTRFTLEARRAGGGRPTFRCGLLAPATILLMGFPTTLTSSGPAASTVAAPTAVELPAQDPSNLPAALPKGKKLVLKDGSYHIVRSYERVKDPANPSGAGRVRFYSIERSGWEEIPADLVDWEATRKLEDEEKLRVQQLTEKARAARTAGLTAGIDVDSSIEISPGVFLPEQEGLYLVQDKAIVPLVQATADPKLDKKKLLAQVFVPVPIIPTSHKIEIAGKQATIRLKALSGENVARPEFYFRVPGLDDDLQSNRAEDREPNLELIRAEARGNHRQLEVLNTYITGERTSKRQTISVEVWKLAKGVFRITIQQGLPPGEYVIAEILPEGMNLYVWDFGVDSAHPIRTKVK